MESRPLIFAQIGCGYWGPNLLRNFSALPNCSVKYVVDSSPERRAFVENNFPRTSAVDSAAAVFNDPEIDAIIVATPAGSHFALASKDRKSTRLNSSHVSISYAVFCLKKKKIKLSHTH